MATISVSAYNLIPCVSGIYVLENLFNGKKYIGQSVNIRRRILAHCRHKRNSNSAIGRAIIKYGTDSFTFTLLQECDKDSLNTLETFWIDKYSTIAPNGYNLVSGGSSRHIISDETKVKMSQSHLGHKRTKESIEKQRQKTIGIKRSEETLIKMSAWQKGIPKPESAERLRRLRKGVTSPNKGVPMLEHVKAALISSRLNKPATWRFKPLLRSDGVLFESIQAAAIAINAHRTTIMKHLSGRLKTVHGYTFSREVEPSQL